MADQRQRVPTFIRVWNYPWVVRGIGEVTFWREIPGKALVAAGVTVIVEALIIPRFGLDLDLFWGVLVYVGIPVLAGWGASLAPLRGKRLDRWLFDQVRYQVGPRRFDRFRPVDGPHVYEIGGDDG
ncbi:MAG TPA: TcpE family conjugal transfer membrane protein [Symbiobacteriaceae bacterium]|nr:TcpE family conjugal transfer membrane protein [Symbiobacteriaceae bacterium]